MTNERANVKNVVIERPHGNKIRIIALCEDQDTGSKVVHDIIEWDDNAVTRRYASSIVANFVEDSNLKVEVTATLNGKTVQMDAFELGRAQKLTSKVAKVLEQADAQF